jgi:hypothetical protein
MKFIVLFIVLMSVTSFAQKKVVYKYKKYEKFNFDDLSLQGEKGSPGDLSVNQRLQRKFKNRLYERRDFDREIRQSIDGLL